MSSVPTSSDIARDPTWLAQALDPNADVVRLIAMTLTDYRDASFLDDRMLQRPVDARILPWRNVHSAMSGERRNDARWIFHIGHVGSTLIARLLGELPSVLSIREPRLLRDLVAIDAEARRTYVPTVRKLMARSFGPDQAALVKATSFVNEIAPELIGMNGKALFVFASPRNYIAGILAGENSVQELQMLAANRAQRLAGRVAPLPVPRHLADLAAIAWACEITALEAAADSVTDDHIAWLEFDAFLDDVGRGMQRIVEHLALIADEPAIAALADSPLLGRYSKAVEYDYSPTLRRALIDEATDAAGASIDEAIGMLAELARSSPLLARGLGRSGGN